MSCPATPRYKQVRTRSVAAGDHGAGDGLAAGTVVPDRCGQHRRYAHATPRSPTARHQDPARDCVRRRGRHTWRPRRQRHARPNKHTHIGTCGCRRLSVASTSGLQLFGKGSDEGTCTQENTRAQATGLGLCPLVGWGWSPRPPPSRGPAGATVPPRWVGPSPSSARSTRRRKPPGGRVDAAAPLSLRSGATGGAERPGDWSGLRAEGPMSWPGWAYPSLSVPHRFPEVAVRSWPEGGVGAGCVGAGRRSREAPCLAGLGAHPSV